MAGFVCLLLFVLLFVVVLLGFVVGFLLLGGMCFLFIWVCGFFSLSGSTQTNQQQQNTTYTPKDIPLYAFGASNSHENYLQALKQL